MGNLDRWSTPKQIKIERAGEPRGTRRGILKKFQRRKGRKARFDEILSARRDCLLYAERIVDERKRRLEHPEWYYPTRHGNSVYVPYEPHYEKWFDKAAKKLEDLMTDAIADKIMQPWDVETYRVARP